MTRKYFHYLLVVKGTLLAQVVSPHEVSVIQDKAVLFWLVLHTKKLDAIFSPSAPDCFKHHGLVSTGMTS